VHAKALFRKITVQEIAQALVVVYTRMFVIAAFTSVLAVCSIPVNYEAVDGAHDSVGKQVILVP